MFRGYTVQTTVNHYCSLELNAVWQVLSLYNFFW